MHNRKISVIGLGYVGLPVAVSFAKLGRVIGFDINGRRVNELNDGIDTTLEFEKTDLLDIELYLTTDPNHLREADFHVITVPTPIDDAKKPDLSPLRSASEILGKHLKRGDIVVYESTVYPGATEEFCIPILENESGLNCGSDFFVGYSPERINPGDKDHRFENIKKVVSGQNKQICDIIAEVYSSVVTAGIFKASSIKVAEAGKVIENTQRDLNIALMNELALILERMNIDTLDVLEAAGTKWNFLPFRPGLVGGHCIGVDPYYLTHKASLLGYNPRVILAGRGINDEMGIHIADRIIKELFKRGIAANVATITVLGMTFKENIPDLRNSKAFDIVTELLNYGVTINIHDPFADRNMIREIYQIEPVETLEELSPANAVILAVPHEHYIAMGWNGLVTLVNDPGILFDVRSVLPRKDKPAHINLLRL